MTTLEKIPAEMRDAVRWVVWRYEKRGGEKPTKIPYTPRGQKASSTNPSTWSSFADVTNARGYDGIGFVLGRDDDRNWMGIDLDNVLKDGEWLDREAERITTVAGSYTERSPSKKGVHIIGWGEKKGNRCRKPLSAGEIEVYDAGRYFTITGDVMGGNDRIRAFSDEFLQDLENVLSPSRQNIQVNRLSVAFTGKTPSDGEIVDMIRASAQAGRFDALCGGDTSGYPSRSEAVYALIGMVNWWTRDADQTYRIVSNSNIIEPQKWARLGTKECHKQLADSVYADPAPWMGADLSAIVPTDGHEPRSKPIMGEMPKLTMNLPADHWVRRYVEHWSSMNDAYPDYHYATALAMLSAGANSVLGVRIRNFGVLKTNLWFMMLGQSSFSRKSTAMKPAKRFVGGCECLMELPGTFSPESLIEVLDETEKVYHFKDEAAQILGGMNQKAYMADLRDMFCQLYDGSPFTRVLRTKSGVKTRFKVEEPYLTLQWATTPENFMRSTTMLDATSGFLYRFLPIYPRYPKETMGLELGNVELDWREMNLQNEYTELVAYINQHGSISMMPTPEAMERYNRWMLTREREYSECGQRCHVHASVLARYIPVVIKLAALLAVGCPGFRASVKPNGHDGAYAAPIPDWCMDEAVRVVDEYFLPTQVGLLMDLEAQKEENVQTKILGALRDNGGVCTVSELLRRLRLKAKDLREHLEALEGAEEITTVTENTTGGRPLTIVRIKRG